MGRANSIPSVTSPLSPADLLPVLFLYAQQQSICLSPVLLLLRAVEASSELHLTYEYRYPVYVCMCDLYIYVYVYMYLYVHIYMYMCMYGCTYT